MTLENADAEGTQDASADGAPGDLPEGLTHLPFEPQREGDPEAGYQALLRGDYVGCGVPRRVWDFLAGTDVAPPAPPAPGSDSDLPYYLSEFTTPRGVDVVAPNCLTCHAEVIGDELIIGGGGLTIDFGGFASQMTQFNESTLDLASSFLNLSEDEELELAKFYDRLRAVAPYVQSQTIGANAADNLAAILFAHRDGELNWHDQPQIDPPPRIVVPLSVPPWWRMAKKSSMLYVGAGRGDLARIMMAASVLCVDDVELARELDRSMPDLYAYLRSIEPPAYPFEIDEPGAERGAAIFDAHCAYCHGTYGAEETYPNLLVDQDVVGTDPALALGGSQFADRFVQWFNDNAFFGELSRLEPQPGYVAPPLDGIWAVAPYLHNGSVPTLEALLDSSLRPTYWTWSYNTADYDTDAVGWRFTALDHGQDEETDEQARRTLYDTTILGYSNRGHAFSDVLSDADRADLLEYLKTL